VVVRLDELRKELMRAIAIAAILVVACSEGRATTSEVESSRAATVDSIVDPQTAVARFTAGVARPDGLAGGEASAAQLVHRFFEALSTADTAAISGMVVSRSEYGYLYYPTSIYSKKPYELPADIAWMLSSEASAKGSRRMLARLGGIELDLQGYECGLIEHEGENEIRSDCSVTYSVKGGLPETRRLFRAIIIRGNAAKFLSYAGDF
jgi:hypothetical protein